MSDVVENPEIRTARLHLRPFNIDDADRIALLLSDFEVSKWLSRVPYPYEHEHALEWIAQTSGPKLPEETSFVIDRGEGLIGSVGFRLDENDMEIGYWLTRPQWGKGLMSEAAEAAISWIFEVSDRDLITSGIFEGNEASLRIQDKLGFEVTGKHIVHCLAQDKDLPHIDTQLTRTRFEMLNT